MARIKLGIYYESDDDFPAMVCGLCSCLCIILRPCQDWYRRYDRMIDKPTDYHVTQARHLVDIKKTHTNVER